jgi:hypothetical protein
METMQVDEERADIRRILSILALNYKIEGFFDFYTRVKLTSLVYDTMTNMWL